MIIHKSAEDYLEQILILLETKGYTRSVDISEVFNITKPSVNVAMKSCGKVVISLWIKAA